MKTMLKVAAVALVFTLLAGCGQMTQGSGELLAQYDLPGVGLAILRNPPTAKGTDVAMEELMLATDAHDRYANLEVAYFTARGSVASGWISFKGGASPGARGRFSGTGQWVQTAQGMVLYAEGWVVFEPNNEPLWAQMVSR
ncbi:MAG: hypothetical protein SFU83_16615 [Meiothermus sp.]|nr:hypothetical protein [Meiothermus sp.]